ncbi:putative coenzyme A biosynthesis bifunctional protein CoaBC [Collibacillus ludicampi]|uniref:Coenzyme A biosynthesis bifunctional protein CoaBC n=1 Tax=Collibacillus ludicampi TaxID=2771369 RepID=A0AAV4LIC0_9BACL|nr:bifunctional phosphopantothenoylcysteine decarboxylase/phosphopantothenate--cysteine ligase CoaBC [Collibacillus ludicampi]GIM47525.1 putative coenzyme A biosynthesis bifunctional protein CoaBC [Collibacillus ludicampi]
MVGKVIVVGVSGGIAAFKTVSLCSALVKAGAEVHVIMTESAVKFVTPLTFQSIVKNPVIIDIFSEPNPAEISHIALADKADLMVIAPATANIIGKVANGIADDMLTTTVLATKAPVLFAPAMNVNMYANPAVQRNLRTLREFGYRIMEPNEGLLACGWQGKGRLPEPEELFEVISQMVQVKRDLEGVSLLVTAGATREPIDPVRYMTNRSTGKMGYAIAEAAATRGASVTLISGTNRLPVPPGVTFVPVQSALEMYEAVMERLPEQDVIVKAAAVADYRPKEVYDQKLKKRDGILTVEFVRNPDIAFEVGKRKRPGQILVGFAAETEHIEEYARNKLLKKNADMIVANDVSQADAGFAVDTNRVIFVFRDSPTKRLPLLSKLEVAHAIIDEIVRLRAERK